MLVLVLVLKGGAVVRSAMRTRTRMLVLLRVRVHVQVRASMLMRRAVAMGEVWVARVVLGHKAMSR